MSYYNERIRDIREELYGVEGYLISVLMREVGFTEYLGNGYKALKWANMWLRQYYKGDRFGGFAWVNIGFDDMVLREEEDKEVLVFVEGDTHVKRVKFLIDRIKGLYLRAEREGLFFGVVWSGALRSSLSGIKECAMWLYEHLLILEKIERRERLRGEGEGKGIEFERLQGNSGIKKVKNKKDDNIKGKIKKRQ